MSHLLKSRSRNSAFTLIELLVVIAIIGILVSLTAAGVMKVLGRSQTVVARIEIGQIEAAVSAAKLNLGNVDELPSIIKLHSRADLLLNDSSQIGINTRNFLTKAFGKSWVPTVSSNTPYMFWLGPSATYPVTLTGMEALVFWLGGIRDSNGNFQGFSAAKTTPWDTSTTKRKGPFFEFKQKQITQTTNYYTMLTPFGGPYVYFSNSEYAYFLANPLDGVYPYNKTSSGTVSAASYYNAKTFQLISSGQDKTFGSLPPNNLTPGGYYKPPYASGSPIFDDIANFSALQLGVGE